MHHQFVLQDILSQGQARHLYIQYIKIQGLQIKILRQLCQLHNTLQCLAVAHFLHFHAHWFHQWGLLQTKGLSAQW